MATDVDRPISEVGAGIIPPQRPPLEAPPQVTLPREAAQSLSGTGPLGLLGGGGQDMTLLRAMLGQPMSVGQSLAAALAGGVSAMRGQSNPVIDQYNAQQKQQQEQATMMWRVQEHNRKRDLEENQAAYAVSETMMENPDPDIRAKGAPEYFKYQQQRFGIRYTPDQQRSLVARGIKGDWLKNFYGDALSTNSDGQPIYAPQALQEKYGFTNPKEFQDWYERRNDPNTLKQHGGYATPQELADAQDARSLGRIDKLSKLFPDLHARPELYSDANRHYREQTGSDLVTVMDDWKNPAVQARARQSIELGKADMLQRDRDEEARKEAIGEAKEARGEQRQIRREGRAEARQITREERRAKGEVLTKAQSAKRVQYENMGKSWVTSTNAPFQQSFHSYPGADGDERQEILEYYQDAYAYRKMQADPLFKDSPPLPPEKPESVAKYEKFVQDRREDAAKPGVWTKVRRALGIGSDEQQPAQQQPGQPPAPTSAAPRPAAPGTPLNPARPGNGQTPRSPLAPPTQPPPDAVSKGNTVHVQGPNGEAKWVTPEKARNRPEGWLIIP